MVKITGSAIEFSATNKQTSVYPAVGTILLWGGDDITKLSTDYLVCDGSSYSISAYPVLSAVLNFKYGGSSGSGSFNLPNLRERIPIGADASANVTYNSTYTGGVDKLVDAHYPHIHGVNFIYRSNYDFQDAQDGGPSRCPTSVNTYNPATDPNFITKNGTVEVSQNYYPQYTLVNYIIRAKFTSYTS
jgi:microcystin-dependent protein